MRVLIGVSGGSDSVALLHLLRTLAPGYGLELHVVHLNHMLRPEAAEDAAFVRKLAHRWGLPATIGCAKVCSIAGRLKIGLEEAGRLARYRLFDIVADRIGAQRIAVAHHKGDQVETVLLNILRGAGPSGMAGMMPRRGRVVRPLLCASKEEIIAYIKDHGLIWRRDASNLSRVFLRNRIRHQLLPLLRREFNPHLDQAILRLVEILQEEDGLLKGWVKRLFRLLLVKSAAPGNHAAGAAARFRGSARPQAPQGVRRFSRGSQPAGTCLPPGTRQPKTVRLSLAGFLGLPLALRRRLLREAVATVGGNLRRLGYRNVDDCLDFLDRGSPGGTVQLPQRVRVIKERSSFSVFMAAAAKHPAAPNRAASPDRAHPQDGHPTGGLTGLAPGRLPGGGMGAAILQVPGETILAELGLRIRARLVSIAITSRRRPTPGEHPARRAPGWRPVRSQLSDSETGSRAWYDYDLLEKPLLVRTRRAGDRLQPFGMRGSKKLKKLFGELRIPRTRRDRVALVLSGDHIIWVVGYRRGQAAPVSKQTRRMLVLEAESYQ